MPLPRWSRLEPAVREALLDAASAEFSTLGYHGASLNRILGAAGLSKGAAYYYFEDKEDLFLTLVELRVGVLFRAALGQQDAPTDAAGWWAWCGQLAWVVFGEVAADEAAWALSRELYALSAGGQSARITAFWAPIREGVEALLAEGQALGAVRDDLPRDLLAGVTMAVGEAFDRWALTVMSEPPESLDDVGPVMDSAMGLFRRLLEP